MDQVAKASVAAHEFGLKRKKSCNTAKESFGVSSRKPNKGKKKNGTKKKEVLLKKR